ncbi:DNA-dependent metalloprotease SPRTN isoform X2 [Leopardus geoffroyi]|uniref:DNA-dependent metalloprotease SPRTN isoform X2 n=1 Tax=Leopardus geoffroyi TaxID=46844 RepID=UPI001E265F6F|nr:DNA-dependent metalloprotease SPRTN isoform X2 [Leopardus geoffroyi]
MDEDLVLALRLQEEWNLQASERDRAQAPLSLVDASWELVDPTPDLQALFVQFNDRFFWGQLEAVEVKWSMRMTLCAGICSYEGRGGMCSIRLSEPLLKLRPRKDLVETLLHEMIHAYLFVTNNDKDREGHGPEFCKHMHRINRLTGANITVYHTFHDEVDEYRRHWWRCDGPCRHRKPYYGYVKRATNRAPSAHDYWWAEHQQKCGGTYVKIKEPENYARKGKGKTKLGRQPAAEKKAKHTPFSTDKEASITPREYLPQHWSALPRLSPGALSARPRPDAIQQKQGSDLHITWVTGGGKHNSKIGSTTDWLGRRAVRKGTLPSTSTEYT